MAYGSTMRRMTRMTGGSPSSSNANASPTQYTASGNTSVWRHSGTDASPNSGSANALLSNAFFGTTMVFSRMTYTGVADTPPTPNTSNHYAGASGFNGSRIEDYSSVIRLKNNSARAEYLDLYEIQSSFLDINNWTSIQNAGGIPLTQDVTGGVNSGDIAFNNPGAGVIDSQAYQESLTKQKFMKKIGTLEFGAGSSGDNTIILEYNIVPPKCRRMNYGTAWVLLFHNDFNKNGITTQNFSYNREYNFSEIPSDYRLPFNN